MFVFDNTSCNVITSVSFFFVFCIFEMQNDYFWRTSVIHDTFEKQHSRIKAITLFGLKRLQMKWNSFERKQGVTNIEKTDRA